MEDTGSSRSLLGRQDQSDMESTRVYGYKGFTEIATRFLGLTKDFFGIRGRLGLTGFGYH